MAGVFLCEDCGQSYTRKNHMTRHARKHNGSRPFVCPDCPEGYTRSDLLARHRRKAHGPFQGPADALRSSISGDNPSGTSTRPGQPKAARTTSEASLARPSPRIGSGSSTGTPSSFTLDLGRPTMFSSSDSDFDSDGGSVDRVSPSDTSSHPSLSPIGSVPVPLPSLHITSPSGMGQSPEDFTRDHFAALESERDRSADPVGSSSSQQPHIPQAFSFSSFANAFPSSSSSGQMFADHSFAPYQRPNPADFCHPRSLDAYPMAGPSVIPSTSTPVFSSAYATTPRPVPRPQRSLPTSLHRPHPIQHQYHNAGLGGPTPRVLKASYLSPLPLPPERTTTTTKPQDAAPPAQTLGAFYLNTFRMETENGLPSPFIRRRATQSTTDAVMNYRPGELSDQPPVATQEDDKLAELPTESGQKEFALHLGGRLHRRRSATVHEERPGASKQTRWFGFS